MRGRENGRSNLQLMHARNFLTESRGQDITEYSLLLAFVVVIAIVIFIIAGDDIKGIWSASSSTVSSANSVAAS